MSTTGTSNQAAELVAADSTQLKVSLISASTAQKVTSAWVRPVLDTHLTRSCREVTNAPLVSTALRDLTLNSLAHQATTPRKKELYLKTSAFLVNLTPIMTRSARLVASVVDLLQLPMVTPRHASVLVRTESSSRV